MQLPDENTTPGKTGSTDNAFTGDPVNENSIGSGASDQGFEPGEESRDDEFRKGAGAKEEVLDNENTTHAPAPTHGLVEEGPGPDA